jgi:hypothetical protein
LDIEIAEQRIGLLGKPRLNGTSIEQLRRVSKALALASFRLERDAGSL